MQLRICSCHERQASHDIIHSSVLRLVLQAQFSFVTFGNLRRPSCICFDRSRKVEKK